MILHRFLAHELKENLRVAFYTKPQTYKIEVSCVVKNNTDGKNHVAVIFPSPPQLSNQKITKTPKYLPKNVKHLKESKFENSYVIWESDLSSNKTMTFKQTFTVEIIPKKSAPGLLKTSDLFLGSEQHVNYKNDLVKKFLSGCKIPSKGDLKIAKVLHHIVVNNLNYGMPITDLYSAEEALTKKQVDCGGFSTLFAALLRNYKIPSRIVSGFLVGPKTSIMHAWVEFMSEDGYWISADPTIEKLLKTKGTTRSGKFGYIGSDHLTLSVGSDLDLEIFGKSLKVDILQNPIVNAKKGKQSIDFKSSLTAKLN